MPASGFSVEKPRVRIPDMVTVPCTQASLRRQALRFRNFSPEVLLNKTGNGLDNCNFSQRLTSNQLCSRSWGSGTDSAGYDGPG